MKFVSILLLLLLLAACAPAATTAPATEVAAAATQPAATVQAQSGAYPYPYPVVVIPNAYPEPGVAGLAPVAPNRSLVTAQMMMQRADATRPAFVILHVLLQSSQPAGGERDMLADMANQELDLHVPVELTRPIEAGQVFQAEVSVSGDEYGQINLLHGFIDQ